eukprot:GHRR01029434.1.p1 GENE.GHRR01029434.1~~GHRR01029434.1.p1  ORF type:complete len:667 (+),score=280.66 GHRR01029434.1:375-2375(+)
MSKARHGVLSASMGAKPGEFKSALAGKEGGLTFELSKLQNEVKYRDREFEAARRELTTLKSTVNTNERLLQQRSLELEQLKERLLSTEGQAAGQAKELLQTKANSRKLESTVLDLQRHNDKLKEKVASLSGKAEVKLLKSNNAQLAEDHKAACSLIRAKDKGLDVARGRLKAADVTQAKVQGLENDLSAARKDLDQSTAEIRTLQQVIRVKEGEISKLNKALATAKEGLEGVRQELNDTKGKLKAFEACAADLSSELGIVRDELARTNAVAQKAAAADARLVKGEGTVPAGQYLEEVKYLNGQIARLKDKLTLADRDLAVAHSIKEKYRSALEAANVDTSELDAATTAAVVTQGTAAAKSAVRRSLGGSITQLLGLPSPSAASSSRRSSNTGVGAGLFGGGAGGGGGGRRRRSDVVTTEVPVSLKAAAGDGADKLAAPTAQSHSEHGEVGVASPKVPGVGIIKALAGLVLRDNERQHEQQQHGSAAAETAVIDTSATAKDGNSQDAAEQSAADAAAAKGDDSPTKDADQTSRRKGTKGSKAAQTVIPGAAAEPAEKQIQEQEAMQSQQSATPDAPDDAETELAEKEVSVEQVAELGGAGLPAAAGAAGGGKGSRKGNAKGSKGKAAAEGAVSKIVAEVASVGGGTRRSTRRTRRDQRSSEQEAVEV